MFGVPIYLEVIGAFVAGAMFAAGGWFPVRMSGRRRWIFATALVGGGLLVALLASPLLVLRAPLITGGAFVLARMRELGTKPEGTPFFSVPVRRGFAIAGLGFCSLLVLLSGMSARGAAREGFLDFAPVIWTFAGGAALLMFFATERWGAYGAIAAGVIALAGYVIHGIGWSLSVYAASFALPAFIAWKVAPTPPPVRKRSNAGRKGSGPTATSRTAESPHFR